jgi:hypothetical protein
LTAATPQAPADKAYWLVGNWHCESRAGSLAARTYSKPANADAINMTNTVRLPSKFYVIMREHYVFDAASEAWTVDSPGNAVWGPMHATADRWLGNEWNFVGRGALPGPRGQLLPEQQIRMVYTGLDDDTFRRAHQTKIDQLWTNYSEEVCTRDRSPRTGV